MTPNHLTPFYPDSSRDRLAVLQVEAGSALWLTASKLSMTNDQEMQQNNNVEKADRLFTF